MPEAILLARSYDSVEYFSAVLVKIQLPSFLSTLWHLDVTQVVKSEVSGWG